ncbi:hypothetical protein [Pendulispora albinea]|uniref:Tetratricopeptide repeat protein n=1 Tax=Pendulispora albinea TaxID=2741071 RepID=A0ABZ2M0C3_9BACT
MRNAVVAAAILLESTVGSIAWAQSGGAGGGAPDAVTAQALFDSGKALMKEGRYTEACDKFQSSHRIDPKPGTVFNLAYCYEQNGQTASAWARYVEAAEFAARDHQRERESYARERARLLAPKLARLTIQSGALPEGAVVRRDGAAVDKAVLGTAVPVDPGEHTVEVTVGGKSAWSTRVHVATGAAMHVNVPPAAALGSAATGVGAAETGERGAAGAADGDAGDAHRRGSWSGQKTLAVVALGVGVVGLGVGTYFGLSAKSKWDDAREQCLPQGCRSASIDMGHDAKTNATIATVGFVAAGAALVGAAALWFTAPSARSTAAAWSIVPAADPHARSAGLVARGSF